MARFLFFLALIIAAASAFVAPAHQATLGASRTAFTSSETSAPQMVPEQFAVEVTNFATQNSALIATSSDDFGGLLFPVFGLLGLGALILFLAPPLADED
mmetsp:Transcript_13961/g.14144  ORF Transcript_13961/g.14144 Transcript_13961/m.14144 type:complete len:100 (-) Transcript_13961:257-556(-)|eukprot:CAMPEP_0171292924 /NCGR_PEP_ID=MMETSP0816-20121228/928_1 /TAXON_ID=420281 /ORGANISM="Proboscia inermis, Strain CCAP1064/1" /LENGTH=99 /DNA_ID=CAMNT_0011763147 /DNA_START=41 /DNA_END=340 /DNA_ORIENTATION=+